MKKQLLLLPLLALGMNAYSQAVTTTVSIGTLYANQKWYSLESGEIATQPKDNWDIAFEITGYSSAILANTQKPNFALYRSPFSAANYAIVDTTGIGSWPLLYNSDTTWATGAFNKGANLSNPNDLGWGVYDLNTHIVTGDSCYVVKLSATSYKKLKIVNLAGGVYTFEYADLNGANPQTKTISKTSYTGKNFAYFDLTNNVPLDREPASASWDLVFGRYTAMLAPNSTAYPVVGVMSNKGVKVAQMNNVNPALTDWSGNYYSNNITTLGHDWKTVDISTSLWNIVNDTIYFIQDKPGNIWKVKFIAFGGSANGNYVFSKEKLSLVGVADRVGEIISQMALYPNPANGNTPALMFTSDASLQNLQILVTDLTGKILSQNSISTEPGLNTYSLSTGNFTPGVYFVRVNAGSYSGVQKLIIN